MTRLFKPTADAVAVVVLCVIVVYIFFFKRFAFSYLQFPGQGGFRR